MYVPIIVQHQHLTYPVLPVSRLDTPDAHLSAADIPADPASIHVRSRVSAPHPATPGPCPTPPRPAAVTDTAVSRRGQVSACRAAGRPTNS
ncbi:hypothetical protein JYU34_002102 [Plutella xylostella]|uniref:Uncharacterized protein n=1 Tax=Plutella xylostella TaxID=51655 RepID=A0ABQ7R1F2_PLUXY|nr:hypothetical protein JYU34_002102 [Plutella xylostella]